MSQFQIVSECNVNKKNHFASTLLQILYAHYVLIVVGVIPNRKKIVFIGVGVIPNFHYMYWGGELWW